MEPSADDRSVSRRTVLGGLAGLTVGAAAATGVSAASSTRSAPEVTVLSRNAYLGVDLFRLFDARSLDGLQRIAGDLLTEFDPDLARVRADAIAAEIDATRPDAVALQEAAAINVQRPGDFGTATAERATTTVFDVLSAIRSALAERGLDYEVAARTVTTDAELPADTDDGEVDVRLTDRDVLLVRSDLDVASTTTVAYENEFGLGIPIMGLGDLAVTRGYCAADLSLGDETVTVVSTHLSSVSRSLRRDQAAELLALLPSDRPVVVGGDFNSGPGAETGAYTRLTATLSDAYAAVHPDRDGFTCCQSPDLRNPTSRLDSRVDALLYRGDLSPTSVGRVGHRPEDRVGYEADGETVQVWPSDHAGVVGTFALGESAAVGSTATASDPTTESRPARTDAATSAAAETEETAPATTEGAGPGLGVLAALAGLAGGLGSRVLRGGD